MKSSAPAAAGRIVVAASASVAVLFGSLVGCAGSGARGGAPAAGGATSSSPARAGASGDRYEAMAALGYQPQWNATAPVTRRQQMSFFNAFEDILVTQESGNTIAVLEASTGARRWALDLAEPLVKFVGNIRDDGTDDIIASSQTELFILDSRTGIIKDRQRLAVIVNTPPVQFGSILVYGSPNGHVQGHNILSGYQQWAHALSGSIEANPVRMGDSVAAISQRGEVVILEPRSGSSLGRARIFSGLNNNPVATETTLFIAARDQSVWAFGAEAGSPLWRTRTEHSLVGQPAYFNNTLFVPIPAEGLTALAAGTGDRLWSEREVTGEVIAVRNGKLIVRQQDEVLAVDPASGEVEQRVRLAGLSMMVPDAFEDGSMYLVEPGGRIQKFSPR